MIKSIYRLIVCFYALLITNGAIAQDASQQAMEVARNFMQKHGRSIQTATASLGRHKVKNNDTQPFYVFNATEGRGFVIVTGDGRDDAVLGYSLEGTFDSDNLNPSFEWWMQEMEQQLMQTTDINARVPVHKAIAPLIKTKWNQGTVEGYIYNIRCPKIGNKYCLTGCVATAMAQIMYYYQWPKGVTTPVPEYTSNETIGTLAELPPVKFDWSNMTLTYDQSSTDAQVKAVATLMCYCGQAAQMDYGLSGSSASLFKGAQGMIDYFDYDPYTYRNIYRSDYTASEWDQIIYDELCSGRPVLYDGWTVSSGHAFICDGCDDEGNYHINWGWGGSQNGYFKLFLANGYYKSQHAFIGIQPNTGIVPDDDTDDDDEVQPDGIVGAAKVKGVEGSVITISMGNGHGNGPQAFGYGLGILAEDGSITPVIENTSFYETYILDEGWSFSFNFDLSKTKLSEGRYSLIPISKQVGSVWKRCTPLDMWFEVNVTASGDISIVVHPVEKLEVSNIRVVEYGCDYAPSLVKATITNKGDKFNDNIYIENVTTSKFLDRMKIKLEPGESCEIRFTVDLVPDTDNIMRFTNASSYNILAEEPVQGKMNLKAINFSLEGNNIATILQPISVTIQNDAESNFHGTLYLLLRNASTTNLLTQVGLEVEAGEVVIVPAQFSVSTPGDYVLIAATDADATNIIGQIPLNIKAVPTTESKIELNDFKIIPGIESQCEVTVTNVGTDAYIDRLYLNLFLYKDRKYTWVSSQNTAFLNLTVGESATFVFRFNDLIPGATYNVECYYTVKLSENTKKNILDAFFDIPAEADAIDDVLDNRSDEVWYTINGIRLQGKPTSSGVYINGTRKVWVR